MQNWKPSLKKRAGLVGWALVSSALTAASCGTVAEPCATGAEGCACYANDTCDAALECLSALCVRDPTPAGGAAAGANSDGAGGTPAGGEGSTGDAGQGPAIDAGGAAPTTGSCGSAAGDAGDGSTGGARADAGAGGGGGDSGDGDGGGEKLLVPGGELAMGQSDDGSDALCPDGTYGGYFCTGGDKPEHAVTVASFGLDAFEVTVARFRHFVDAFDGTPPEAGAGAHPQLAFSGWQTTWNEALPSSRAALLDALKCAPGDETWTDTPGLNEQAAINCVSWYEAFAFCAWDGGYLPTEAEWEYAAAGGDENRMFPWGSTNPAEQINLANDAYNGNRPTIAVGSEHPQGDGRWGHRDLAGGVSEWVLDRFNRTWYSSGGATCNNCANLNAGTSRVAKGGSWVGSYPWAGGLSYVIMLRAADRAERDPALHDASLGIRCARKP
ncbi:MAG: formylglycine-generating enzyme family protein [Myxococcales bacterium]|nr:MAG: formylglycine-generating enzyme family protein [Myxococcales bacterium]